MVLGDDYSRIDFPIELEDPIKDCPAYEWRDSDQNDGRYSIAGSTNLLNLQESAGIIDILERRLPEFLDQQNVSLLNIRERLAIDLMIKRAHKWDIDCESQTSTSRQSIFDKLHELRAYFYPIEEQDVLYDRSIKHRHESFESWNVFHDDEHTGEFHLHF